MCWNFLRIGQDQRFMSQDPRSPLPLPTLSMSSPSMSVPSAAGNVRRRVRGAVGRGLAMLGLAAQLAAPAAWAMDDTREPAEAGDLRRLDVPGGALQVEVLGTTDPQRADDLHRWAAEAARATLTAYGRFPLRQARIRIEQSASHARSPVPWGQTSRRDGVAVLLYVREDATLQELREDWTAVHELAHLFHPYLGAQGRWLSEGLASYYQNVLRARAGLLDDEDAWRRLDAGFGRGRREDSGLPLRELSQDHRGTMRVYWAGAAYWLEADLALRRERGSTLEAVLSQYDRCCLRGTGEVAPETFVAELDRIAGGDLFASRFARYAEATTFPPLEEAYAALGLSTRDGELQLSADEGPRALRRAVMGRRPTTK
ncbi:M61 metallopeptidase family protein [Agrilutibacter solisilvae]|uniref:Peptidase M61 catalytic domain-containing protein n=1 Tax=Agrilutibacter solisilvae TaxID=2763317 RepID=A0A974Y0S2_9GAMM|nr:hypothetical protein [Lysobacter solisilvae]QSX79316.1 hypothetical protein I8J32_005430 [Lysobacter solisilvae]